MRSTSASRDQGKGSVDPIFLVLRVVAGLDRARINPAGLVAGTNFLPVDGGANDIDLFMRWLSGVVQHIDAPVVETLGTQFEFPRNGHRSM